MCYVRRKVWTVWMCNLYVLCVRCTVYWFDVPVLRVPCVQCTVDPFSHPFTSVAALSDVSLVCIPIARPPLLPWLGITRHLHWPLLPVL